MAAPNQKMSSEEALTYFDSLEPVDVPMMIGTWHGQGIDTDHPMDGLLEASRWIGKRFDGPDAVYPLVHKGLFGRDFFVNPALLPLGLVTHLPLRDPFIKVLFPLLSPFLSTGKPKARLRMTEFRGKVSATMQYDARPINDVFRKIDARNVLGLMDHKGAKTPFFFKLTKVA
ncbi:DUF4334 domain-containing protein [Ascidiaceihabitans sp.]|uniref:DUF4334 domain-containing protein n=1 Tax=Ascidiaceihabitans sp. TaxID=1872644 RepID=UPI0032982437